ncbi:MAG: ketopantoate reductase family protein [Opitutus sp.]|nr:ketopantoate reductase family protein [Opitutus sp.]
MRYIVYGAGAIGSILGGHLRRLGSRVVLVGSAPHVQAIRKRGLSLRTAGENFRLHVPAFPRAAQLAPFRPDDVVLLCAKTQQTARCLSQLRQAGAPRSLAVFCCQNSFVNEPLATLFFDRVYGVTVFVDGIYLQPGEVVNASGRTYGHLEIGRYPLGLDPVCRRVAQDLRGAGFSVRTTADVMRTKRAKFIASMANAVIGITNQPTQVAPLVRILRTEARRVLRATGMTCEPLGQFRRRAKAACGELRLPADVKRAGQIPDSTWQSLSRGTGNVETPFFNGLVVRLGRQLGIPTPANELVVRVAQAMARRGQRPGRHTAGQLLGMIRRVRSAPR